jgi:hypothetical protein
MARTVLAVATLSRAGTRILGGFDVAADTVNQQEFPNDGATFLIVRNADGAAAHNVTFYAQGAIEGNTIPIKTISIPLSSNRWFGPFASRLYNQANGNIPIDGDSAQLFFQIVRVPPVN